MKKLKVAVGLSGGVDSAVSAYLLKKQGFDVSCIYLNCFDDDMPGCRGKQDRQDALSVALHLKLPFQVLDFRQEYKAAVIDYFKQEYLAGRTPNPDVVCNRDIKFGLLLDWCIKNRFDYLATGHYAKLIQNTRKTLKAGESDHRRIRKSEIVTPAFRLSDSQNFRSSEYSEFSEIYLTQPKDLHKDQTYFLWAVPQEKFRRVLFPLADFRKQDVRSVAKFVKIPVAAKPDSTGICFVGEVRVEDFLKRLGVKEKIGEVITTDGRIIGSHRGVWFYTIGQRHGFAINSKGLTFVKQRLDLNIPPLYVIEKDVKANRLVVGFGAETYRRNFEVAECNWLIGGIRDIGGIRVRIRHCGELIPCRLSVNSEQLTVNGDSRFTVHGSRFTVRLREPQRGVAPGQSAVFYSEDGIVLGGGVIQ